MANNRLDKTICAQARFQKNSQTENYRLAVDLRGCGTSKMSGIPVGTPDCGILFQTEPEAWAGICKTVCAQPGFRDCSHDMTACYGDLLWREVRPSAVWSIGIG